MENQNGQEQPVGYRQTTRTRYAIHGIDEINIEGIPQKLKDTPRWVCWKAVASENKAKKKPEKVPIDPKTGSKADITVETSWGTFQQAVDCCREDGLAGIGFAFNDDGIVGVDFDKVLVDGKWTPEKVAVLLNHMQAGGKFAAYAEMSPSATGFKVFVQCLLAGPRDIIRNKKFKLNAGKADEVDMEVYSTKRFFTVTGHAIACGGLLPGDAIVDAIAKAREAEAKPKAKRKHDGEPSRTVSKYEQFRVQTALKHIDPDGRQEWLDMCFALKEWGDAHGCDAKARTFWDDWSKGSPKYDEALQDSTWDKTKVGVPGGIKAGTLFEKAKEGGWDGVARDDNGQKVEPHGELFDGPPPPLVSMGGRMPFPLDTLPPAYAAAAAAASKALGWDTGTVAACMLGIASAAVVDKAVVKVNGTWTEKLPLWIWAVAPTGAKKSPLLRFVSSPLTQELAADLERHEVEERLHRAVAMRAQEEINKLKRFDGDNTAKIAALMKKIEDSPASPDYFGTDVTPEGAADDMRKRQRPGRPVKLVLITGEGSEIGNAITGHYSDGSTANAVFLKGHDGDDHSVKRKGDREKSFRIRGGLVQIITTIQPEVLAGYISKSPLLEAEGLLPRCNPVLADYAGAKFVDAEVDAQVAEAYRQEVVKLVRLPHGELDGLHPMRLSKDATEAFGRHYDWAEKVAMEAGLMRGWMSKLTGKTIRVAGLLHLMWGNGPSTEMSVQTLGAAVRVADWLRCQAEAVMLEHVSPGEMTLPARIVEWIISKAATKVTVREVYDSLRRNTLVAGNVKAVQDALDHLSEMGYVAPLNERNAPRGPTRGGRPPSPTFAVNPAIRVVGFSPWGKAAEQTPSPEAIKTALKAGEGLPQSMGLEDMAEPVGTSDRTAAKVVVHSDGLAGTFMDEKAGAGEDPFSWFAK